MTQAATEVGAGGLRQSVLGSGRAVAPAAAAILVAAITPGLGTWAIKVKTMLGVGAIAADESNLTLDVTGVAVMTIPSRLGTDEITITRRLAAVDTVRIAVVANATAAIVYSAAIVCDRISG